jgi:hypothetical protein
VKRSVEETMIFIASVEVEPLTSSQMGDRGIGACVYCLIPAESKVLAGRKLKECLVEDKYRLVNLEFLEKYDGFAWENEEDQIEFDRLAKRAALNNELVYGTFYTWKQNE